MPAVDDMDSTYINGTFIGTTNQWDAVRKYKIPAGVLKAGKNILVIKVQDNGGGGGLNNVEDQFNISVGNKIIPFFLIAYKEYRNHIIFCAALRHKFNCTGL